MIIIIGGAGKSDKAAKELDAPTLKTWLPPPLVSYKSDVDDIQVEVQSTG